MRTECALPYSATELAVGQELVSKNFARPSSGFVSMLILGLLADAGGGGVGWGTTFGDSRKKFLNCRHHANILRVTGLCFGGCIEILFTTSTVNVHTKVKKHWTFKMVLVRMGGLKARVTN